MSIFDAIFKSNAVSGYAEAFQATDCTSKWMQRAIQEWFRLYFTAEKNDSEDPCQQIPYTVVNKLTRTAFSEYNATSEDTYAQLVLDSLDGVRQEAMQMALIGGECLLKPVIDHEKLHWTVVPRTNLLVFGRDAKGNMTDIGTAEHQLADKFYFTLLERRTVDANGYLTIRNSLYRSTNQGQLGQRVPLQTLEQYAQLPDKYTYREPIGSVGLVQMHTPMVNCVDGSKDGVAVFAAAVPLIRNINRNSALLDGEFERGKSRLVVSADMLEKDVHGNPKISDNLFVGLDEDQESVGITIFSPALREESYLTREQAYLRAVENIIGLKRGLLSEVEAAERTATEITSSQGDYNLTIIDFQNLWEKAVREAVRLCGIIGRLYKVPDAHDVPEDKLVLDWGNGVLYDEQKTWEDYKAMVAAGLLKPEIAIGWRFNLPTETPEDLAKIRQKYMPGMEDVIEE